MNDPHYYSERMRTARARAAENHATPAALQRDSNGEFKRPFLAALLRANIPRLNERLDALTPMLQSDDPGVRERAENALTALSRQMDALEG